MAQNEVHEFARRLVEPVAAGVVSGDPVLVGQRTGVAMSSRDTSGNASVDYLGGYNLSVKAVNDSGNSAVAYGDMIYYVDTDTPKLSKKASGIPFGFARSEGLSGTLIAAGATATIEIAQVDAVLGTADLAPGSITTAMLAALAVTGAKMDAFYSAVITGTGAEQNTAHGLGVVPSIVIVTPTLTAAGVTLTQGTHTTTNCVVTCTAGDKYQILAIA